MEIINIDELKNLVREVVKEELASKGSSTNQDQNQDQVEEKNASHQQLDEVRNRIQQMGQSDIADEAPRSIPSTPLSPGNQSTGQSPINPVPATPTPAQPVTDMEI